MRYSMLVHLTRMANTLLEAAQYLHGSSADSLRDELTANGRQMLGQMKATLLHYKDDLKSSMPLDRLTCLEELWERVGEESRVEEMLQEFAAELPSEVNYQVRAVFFAELGEKWDAMESVYTYMRDDPRFDPVVVLTPIFRIVQQANGETKQEVIYKDYLTPLGIPFLEYNEYDIEKDCPELAFSSQPYESCTLPEFWAENIAKHTRLVYLPYYLPDRVTQNSVKALCQLPMYQYAWKVAGLNEKFLNFYRQHSYFGGTNMILTGIPKTDPLVTLNTRDIPLPRGWEKLHGKKVFLWNSWYDMNASSLRYFENLIHWFDQHQDCALIWRPHPMTDTVTKLYYPDDYSRFQKYKSKISALPNGVLDCEISCDAAFRYSDAQISDYSSLMPQYLFVDKPLLWIKNPAWEMTGEEFISTAWMETAFCFSDIASFFECVCRGSDKNRCNRKRILDQDLCMSDGECGIRICENMWSALHEEHGIAAFTKKECTS